MANTKIEWTDKTWNPVTGCTKVSPGCLNCYAERMAKRLQAMGVARYAGGFKPTIMSDLFNEDVPVEFIREVFCVINKNQRHQFQILTKRANRLAKLAGELLWTPNIWMGVSIENQDYIRHAEILKNVPAQVRFLSIEPLLEPIDHLPLDGIHWVIVGGESGPGARPMHPDWVRSIRDQCIKAGVPFFFKQWGGVNKKAAGRLLDGRTWDEMPKTEPEMNL